MRDRVTFTHVAHIFARVTRAGAASGRPYGRKVNGENPVLHRAGREPPAPTTATARLILKYSLDNRLVRIDT